MPNLIVYDTGRKLTTQFTVAFARGVIRGNNELQGNWNVKHMSIGNYLTEGIPANTHAVATLGILRGTGLMLREAQSLGIDYYYMDHAYFNSGYSGKGYLRVTKNAHSCNTLEDAKSKKFDTFTNYTLEDWRSNEQRGEKILILPPTDAVGWYFMDKDWLSRTVEKIKSVTDREIVVRYKPAEPVVDDRGFLLELRNPEQSYPPLAQQLDDSFCVVAYNSMAALEATLKGIPVITSENSCCIHTSFAIGDLADPLVFNHEPENRRKLVYWLPHNQWNRRQLEDGTAWKELVER